MPDPPAVETREAVVRIFYRIVKTVPPTIDDFLSNQAKGKQPRHPTPEILRLWDGISVYDTLRQARITARLFPRLGQHIAILRIPDDGRFRIEQKQDPAQGHFTLWGDAAQISDCVAGDARLDAVD